MTVPIAPLFSTRFSSATLEAILSLSSFICSFNFSPRALFAEEVEIEGVVDVEEVIFVGVGVAAKAGETLRESASTSDVVNKTILLIIIYLGQKLSVE